MDTFLSTYNHANGYSNGTIKLTCGNTVTIQDGTYNVQWMIAGFDVEAGITSDGITDNGYGIALIPVSRIFESNWNANDTLTGYYLKSTMHTTTLPTIATKLQNILGSHLVNRNVLLRSDTFAYTWTTAYCTLMSSYQLIGESGYDKYDIGEANYKLPIFDKITNFGLDLNYRFWIRDTFGYTNKHYNAYRAIYDGTIGYHPVSYTSGIRPLIYIN